MATTVCRVGKGAPSCELFAPARAVPTIPTTDADARWARDRLRRLLCHPTAAVLAFRFTSQTAIDMGTQSRGS
ncbi:hypothetical protein SSBR45G_74170 [Bradyrhizobium sp. SSBR45G]|nr:hypothetical protein SSBR45G_74170 [Bradyrhizobium sp. SSBR45G]GLH89955.1 hypothetical protein SSBR45R_74160 [Bradyrhizobium sp. SSBR45R]